MNQKYRIYRTDSRNLAIQHQTSKGRWVTESYHGNNPRSLASGLLDLVGAVHVPDGDKPLQLQLSDLIAHIEHCAGIIDGIANGPVAFGPRFGDGGRRDGQVGHR